MKYKYGTEEINERNRGKNTIKERTECRKNVIRNRYGYVNRKREVKEELD
jgi:hypothetical protein